MHDIVLTALCLEVSVRCQCTHHPASQLLGAALWLQVIYLQEIIRVQEYMHARAQL